MMAGAAIPPPWVRPHRHPANRPEQHRRFAILHGNLPPRGNGIWTPDGWWADVQDVRSTIQIVNALDPSVTVLFNAMMGGHIVRYRFPVTPSPRHPRDHTWSVPMWVIGWCPVRGDPAPVLYQVERASGIDTTGFGA